MKTTAATYLVNVTTEDENIISFYKTMPTRPTTQKGIKSQNNKIEKWAMSQYPNWTEINIELQQSWIKMTQIKDNIIDRDALQASYIDRIIDGMDLKDLMQIVYDQLDDSLDKYSVDELIEEVDSYYPELLEESEEK